MNAREEWLNKAKLLAIDYALEFHQASSGDAEATAKSVAYKYERLLTHISTPPEGYALVPAEPFATAYGLLWHVNAGLDAPADVVSATPEQAAYAARKLLRELLTNEQRGNGINCARQQLIAAPKEE